MGHLTEICSSAHPLCTHRAELNKFLSSSLWPLHFPAACWEFLWMKMRLLNTRRLSTELGSREDWSPGCPSQRTPGSLADGEHWSTRLSPGSPLRRGRLLFAWEPSLRSTGAAWWWHFPPGRHSVPTPPCHGWPMWLTLGEPGLRMWLC